MTSPATLYNTNATDKATAKIELLAAYRPFEKNGLELGRVAYKWREACKSRGGYGSRGEGLVQLLDELSIPKSTVYYWIGRWELKQGIKEKPSANAPEVYTVENNEPTLDLPDPDTVVPDVPEAVPAPATVIESVTTHLRALFKGDILVRPSRSSSGLQSCRGKYSIDGLTENQIRQIAKLLEGQCA